MNAGRADAAAVLGGVLAGAPAHSPVGVFACGPPPMVAPLRVACAAQAKLRAAPIRYHAETFEF